MPFACVCGRNATSPGTSEDFHETLPMIQSLTSTSSAASAAPNRRTAQQGRTVQVSIKRCDGPNKPSRWETFKVTTERGMNVISALMQIAANPTTIDGKQTTPPVWDSGCLEEVCGSCTMVINGKVRQSCSCLLDDYVPNEGDTLTLEPMSKFPVIRDLWVDRERLFHNLKRVKAWVPIDGTYSLGAGPRETPAKQEKRVHELRVLPGGLPSVQRGGGQGSVGHELHRRPRHQPGPTLQRA
jgi:hypothetical protein